MHFEQLLCRRVWELTCHTSCQVSNSVLRLRSIHCNLHISLQIKHGLRGQRYLMRVNCRWTYLYTHQKHVPVVCSALYTKMSIDFTAVVFLAAVCLSVCAASSKDFGPIDTGGRDCHPARPQITHSSAHNGVMTIYHILLTVDTCRVSSNLAAACTTCILKRSSRSIQKPIL